MQRITVTLDEDLLAAVDSYMAASGATNRSEAMRDLIGRGLDSEAPQEAPCLGVASYTLDPAKRDLGRKVPKVRQDHHDRVAAALTVPVDHSTSLEVAVLQGTVGDVSAIANALFLERGVRHGTLSLVPLGVDAKAHTHSNGTPHLHMKVLDRFG